MILDKTRKTLEFDAVTGQLTGLAATAPGRQLCQALVPLASYKESLEALTETEDALLRLVKFGDLPLSGISDIRPAVGQARAGAVLDNSDLLRIAAFLRALDRILQEIKGDGREGPQLLIHERAGQLVPLPGFLRRLEQSVKDDRDLFDQASETLYGIRVRLREAQTAVRRELDKILAKQAEALQEPIITIRSGRFVVPVRSDRRGQVRGIVHDTSSTGSTLFIEPMAVVDLNNKIRELEAAEEHEILIILQELSEIVAKQSQVFLDNLDIVAGLDLAMAKAKLASRMDASLPRLNKKGEILLLRARHPLIDRDRVVPIDFELGRSFRTLVITGPNTGGKTVSLKTCGLLTLMAMAGLFIPAREESSVAWFERVEADIGDEQSIEQNLSTFSSHMREIIRITDEARPGTLVLLDELGAGTDPSEGAALAIAILDHLKARGCHTVATTHYRELKGYAMNEEGVENACCEFDTKSLQPTYKLLIGVPGVSNAFAISSRLGLSPRIIDSARSLISEEGARFEDLVSAIEQSHREASAMEEKIRRLHLETEEAREILAEERKKLERERLRWEEEARGEAAELLEAARKDIDQLLEDLNKEAKEAQPADHRLASEARGRLSSIGRKYEVKKPAARRGEELFSPDDLILGESYLSKSLGVSGIVREAPDARGQVVLEAGSFRVTVPFADLQRSRPKRAEKSRRSRLAESSSSQLRSNIVMRAGTELMLLGKRVDEALGLLDQFLDEAVLAGLSTVRIVHGKGTGALRKATHDSLSRDRRVKSFRQGGDGEGGDGVTVAELDLS